SAGISKRGIRVGSRVKTGLTPRVWRPVSVCRLRCTRGTNAPWLSWNRTGSGRGPGVGTSQSRPGSEGPVKAGEPESGFTVGPRQLDLAAFNLRPRYLDQSSEWRPGLRHVYRDAIELRRREPRAMCADRRGSPPVIGAEGTTSRGHNQPWAQQKEERCP